MYWRRGEDTENGSRNHVMVRAQDVGCDGVLSKSCVGYRSHNNGEVWPTRYLEISGCQHVKANNKNNTMTEGACRVGLNDLSFSDRNCDFRQCDHVIAKAAIFFFFFLKALLTDPGSVVKDMPSPSHLAKITNQKRHATRGQVTLTNQY